MIIDCLNLAFVFSYYRKERCDPYFRHFRYDDVFIPTAAEMPAVETVRPLRYVAPCGFSLVGWVATLLSSTR